MASVHLSTDTTAATVAVAVAARRGVAALAPAACQPEQSAVKRNFIRMVALAPAVPGSTGWSVRQKQQSMVSLLPPALFHLCMPQITSAYELLL
jgi:hypothetical protein